jgi:hypothetical protein
VSDSVQRRARIASTGAWPAIKHIIAQSEISSLDLVLNTVPALEVHGVTTSIRIRVRAASA